MCTHVSKIGHSLLLTITWFVIAASGCTHPLEHNWQAYREAKKRGDYATVATLLADDARIWFDKKKGAGHPLRATGGPYQAAKQRGFWVISFLLAGF